MQVRSAWVGACIVAMGVAIAPVVQGGQERPALLPPPVRGLTPVPSPRLDMLEPTVAAQLRDGRQEASRRLETTRDPRALAGAYGDLARLYHVYEFFDAAEPAYQNAARLAPGDARWSHLLGYLYQQTGRFAEAVDRFESARRAAPADAAATLRLGEMYVQLDRISDARRAFQDVAAVFPAAASSGLGEAALREGRFDEAIAHFNRALALVPQATALHYSLAMAYRGLGRLDDARAHLERRGPGGIVAVDPVVEALQALVRGERALVMRGRRAYEAGQFTAAEDAFRLALATAPSSVAARLNLGLTLLQVGDAAGAVEHLHVAFDAEPVDGAVGRALVGALLRLGREDDAIAALNRLTTADPGDEDATVGLAILLADQRRYEEAVALLGEANRQFPERTATATTLARLLASAPVSAVRDGGRALELAQTVFAVDSAPVHAETVALALAELGRCTEAAEWIGRAVGAAEVARDVEEIARLRNEASKYADAPCRPPGQ